MPKPEDLSYRSGSRSVNDEGPRNPRVTRDTKVSGYTPTERGDRYSASSAASGAGDVGLRVNEGIDQIQLSAGGPVYGHLELAVEDPYLQVTNVEYKVSNGRARMFFWKIKSGSTTTVLLLDTYGENTNFFRTGEKLLIENSGTAADGNYWAVSGVTYQDTNSDGTIDQATVTLSDTLPAAPTTGIVQWSTLNNPDGAIGDPPEEGVAGRSTLFWRHMYRKLEPYYETKIYWRIEYRHATGVTKTLTGGHTFDYDQWPELSVAVIVADVPDLSDTGTPINLLVKTDEDATGFAWVWGYFDQDDTTVPDWDLATNEDIGPAGASTLGFTKGWMSSTSFETIALGNVPHNKVVKVRLRAMRRSLSDTVGYNDGEYRGEERVITYENKLVKIPSVTMTPSQQSGTDARMQIDCYDPQGRITKCEFRYKDGDLYSRGWAGWFTQAAEGTPTAGFDATYRFGWAGEVILDPDTGAVIEYQITWKDDDGALSLINGSYFYDYDMRPEFKLLNVGWEIDTTTHNRYPEYIQVDYALDEDANYLLWGFVAVDSAGLIGGYSSPEAYFAVNPPTNQVPGIPAIPGDLGGTGSLKFDGVDQNQIDIPYGGYGWFCFAACRTAWGSIPANDWASGNAHVIYKQVRRLNHQLSIGVTDIGANILLSGDLPDFDNVNFADTFTITGGVYEYPDGKRLTLPSDTYTVPATGTWYYIYYDVSGAAYASTTDLGDFLKNGDPADILIAAVYGGDPPKVHNYMGHPWLNHDRIVVTSLSALFGQIDTLWVEHTLNIKPGGEFIAGTSTDGVIIDDTGIRGVSSSVTQFSLDVATGAATAGGGAVTLDANGITMSAADVYAEDIRSIIWNDGTDDVAAIYGHSLSGQGVLALRAYQPTTTPTWAHVSIAAQVPGATPARSASIALTAGTSYSSAIELTATDSLYYQSLTMAGGVAQFTLTSGGYISIGYGGSVDQYRLPVDVGLTGQALVKTSGGALLQWISVQQSDPMLDDISALTDPGADRILFWDDSAGLITWLTVGSGLAITDTTLATTGGGGSDYYANVTDGTTTATASGSDTFKLRSANNRLTIAVQNNDATHGDNALFTLNEANLSIAESQIVADYATFANATHQHAASDITSGTLATARGGTGLTTPFVVGDIMYASSTSAWSRLAGNATSLKKFLTQTGTGVASAAPVWDNIYGTDVIISGGATNNFVSIDASDNLVDSGYDATDFAAASHTHTYSQITDLSSWAGSTSITTLGTVGTGTWQGGVIASAYLDADTAHLSGAQSFTGEKTFSAGLVVTYLNNMKWTNVTTGDTTLQNTNDSGTITITLPATTGTLALTSQLASYQPLDAGLTSISGLTTAADQMIYLTAADTYAVTTLSSFARTLLDDGSATTARATLGAAATSHQHSYTDVTDLSTWAGSTAITTLGTITSGTWNGSDISGTYISVTGTLGNLIQIGTNQILDAGVAVSNLATLSGTQTFSGSKTFTLTTLHSDGLWLTGGGAPTATSGRFGLYADAQEVPKGQVGTGGTVGIPITWDVEHNDTTVYTANTAGTNIYNFTLPANQLVAGQKYRMEVWGYFAETGGLNTNSLTFRVLVDSTIMVSATRSFALGFDDNGAFHVVVEFFVPTVVTTNANVRAFLDSKWDDPDDGSPTYESVVCQLGAGTSLAQGSSHTFRLQIDATTTTTDHEFTVMGASFIQEY